MSARVLIVDDTQFIRRIMSDLLSLHGYDVVGEAATGTEAVASYKSLKPDLVTLDMTLPEKDGLDVLREILGEDPAAKVIICSSMNERPKVMEALSLGACDYILKPAKPERVLEAVQKALA